MFEFENFDLTLLFRTPKLRVRNSIWFIENLLFEWSAVIPHHMQWIVFVYWSVASSYSMMLMHKQRYFQSLCITLLFEAGQFEWQIIAFWLETSFLGRKRIGYFLISFIGNNLRNSLKYSLFLFLLFQFIGLYDSKFHFHSKLLLIKWNFFESEHNSHFMWSSIEPICS